MRIAHVLTEVAPIGGAETYAFGTADAQRARGDDVELVLAGTDTQAFDVVHVHGTMPAAGRRVVRSLHDYAFGCASGERRLRSGAVCTRAHGSGCLTGIALQGCAHRLDLRPVLRSHRSIGRTLPLLHHDDAIVVHSNAVRDAAAANGLARVHVVPYFVERVAEPTPPPPRRVAFVGRVVGAKGLDVALRALALVPDAWDRFDVVGDGWALPAARALSTRLGLDGRVVFHGSLPAGGVHEVLEETTVLVLPSLWPEPFGIVGLEAFAHARPVVASNTGGIPEWLDDHTGALVAPGDEHSLAAALVSVLANADELGRTAWTRVARFSTAAHLAALDAIYVEAA